MKHIKIQVLLKEAVEQTDVLSPSHFSLAIATYEQAKEDHANSKNSRVVLRKISEARAYLRLAHQVAELNRGKLGAIVTARKEALSARAEQIFKKEFNKADDELIYATRKAEKNDFSDLEKNRGALLTRYLDLEVEGHTDAVGTKKSNAQLSTRRAQSVANYLLASKAVEQSDLTTVGFGSENPIAPNTNLGKAKNRRVDVIIVSQRDL